MSINYGYVLGAVAAPAPFDNFHGDLDIDIDIDYMDQGDDYDYNYDYDYDYDYDSDSDYQNADLGEPPDSDDSLPSPSPALHLNLDRDYPSNPGPDPDLDSDSGQEEDESAVDEAAAVPEQYDQQYGYGDLTESDEEHDQDEAEDHYIPGAAHYFYGHPYPHPHPHGYSSAEDSSIRESSVASTVSVAHAHAPAPPVAPIASSDDEDAPSPAPSSSQNSAVSGSGPGSVSVSVFGSGSELSLASGPDPASPQPSESGPASASASPQAPGDPHHRRQREHPRVHRLSDHFDIYNLARAWPSPRRPSLTPTIHPNRRLPMNQQQPHPPNQSQNQNQNRQNHIPVNGSDNYDYDHDHDYNSSSSPDELNPHHSRPRIVRSRNLRFADGAAGISSDEDGNVEASDHSFESEQGQDSGGFSAELAELLGDSDEEEQWEIRDLGELGQRVGREQRLDRLTAHRAARAAREADRLHRAARRVSPAGWDSDLDLGPDMDGDDELIEVVWDRQLNARPTPPQRRPQRRQRIHRQNNSNNNIQGEAVDVIDLTEEPDSPVLQNHRPVHLRRAHNPNHIVNQQAPHHHPRNPRRPMAQNGRTPSLSRSDGSILGHPPAVIDLTSDSPDDAAREDDLDLELEVDDFENIPANRRLPAPVPAPQRNHRRSVEFLGNIGGLGRGFLGLGNIRGLFPGILAHIGHPHDAEVQIVGGQHAFHMNPDPLAGNPPEFNYQANGFGGFGGRQPTPKPAFEAPPAARPGFTRHTGPDRDTNEEMVVVCASCDNELKYSVDDDDDGQRPAKRPRTKKDREEHHFWAVKACGHVYCKSCYDNRRKTKGKEYRLGFRVDASGSSKTPKIFCAVEECDSDVSANNAWVGIFM